MNENTCIKYVMQMLVTSDTSSIKRIRIKLFNSGETNIIYNKYISKIKRSNNITYNKYNSKIKKSNTTISINYDIIKQKYRR